MRERNPFFPRRSASIRNAVSCGLFAGFLLFLSGCSSLFWGSESGSGAVIESTDTLPGSDTMPFSLEVVQEVNDGRELHILGSVKANTEWNPDEVVLRLTSLRDGVPVGVVHHSLRKLIESRVGISRSVDEMIKTGQETTFSLSVPSISISDYQLVLLWGDEADQFLDKKVIEARNRREAARQAELKAARAAAQSTPIPAPVMKTNLKLRVHSIEIETLKAVCSYPPCDVRFRLKALLQNEGTGVIGSARLGVGFIPIELLGTQTAPEDEEEVEIPKLGLQPGVSRPFRILLNQEMSEEVADTVRPVLRIISFE